MAAMTTATRRVWLPIEQERKRMADERAERERRAVKVAHIVGLLRWMRVTADVAADMNDEGRTAAAGLMLDASGTPVPSGHRSPSDATWAAVVAELGRQEAIDAAAAAVEALRAV